MKCSTSVDKTVQWIIHWRQWGSVYKQQNTTDKVIRYSAICGRRPIINTMYYIMYISTLTQLARVESWEGGTI